LGGEELSLQRDPEKLKKKKRISLGGKKKSEHFSSVKRGAR